MLLGIKRALSSENPWFNPPVYEYEVLIGGNETIDRDTLIAKLDSFRRSFVQSERDLVSSKNSCEMKRDTFPQSIFSLPISKQQANPTGMSS